MPKKFVVQQHYRGKSVHSDVRLEGAEKGGLLGWTVNVQRAGQIKEPVLTLAQAREEDRRADAFKINWATGEWAKRKREGGRNGEGERSGEEDERKGKERRKERGGEGERP